MSSPETTPPAEYPAPPPTTVVTPAVVPPIPRPLKSPGAAMLLSLVMPGLGQFYNGHLSKAIFFFFAFTGTIYLVVESNPLPFAFFLPFIMFSNMIDAYRSATGALDAQRSYLGPSDIAGSSFSNRYADIYREVIDLLAELGREGEAFDVLLAMVRDPDCNVVLTL